MARFKNVDGNLVQFTEGEEVERDADEALALAALSDPVNYSLNRWQFHAMLEILDVVAAVNGYIDAITDSAQRAVVRAKLTHADLFDRRDPIITTAAAALGLTDEELDAAWMRAKIL